MMISFLGILLLAVQALPSQTDPLIDDTTLPSTDFRVPAEYEPVSTVLIAWAGYYKLLTQIAQAAAVGNANVWAIRGPPSIEGVDPAKYKSLDLLLNTAWMRDYGPVGGDQRGNLTLVDYRYTGIAFRRLDDIVPIQLAELYSYPSYQSPLFLDGGNYMMDTQRNLFTTKRTYLWNGDKTEEQVDAILRGYPGDAADSTGHIDMFAKLLSDETVLIATSADEPFKTNGENAIKYFESIKTPYGNDYKILTVDGWVKDGKWYSYVNSLIVNNVVIVPSYVNRTQEEVLVKQTYEEGIPGVTVIFVESDSAITRGGAVHCLTQTIPKLKFM